MLVLFRALPRHARKTLERDQRLAAIGPFLLFLDADMVERLPAGAAQEQRARDVHHVRRARALVKQRRAAARAKTSRGLCRLVLEAVDCRHPPGETKTLPPAPDIGGVGRTMRAAAGAGMIVPGPAGGII